MRTPVQSQSARSARARFLVVEDERVLCREIGRILAAHGDTVLAETLVDAHHSLDTVPNWAAAVVDIHLQPGSGLDVVDRLGVEHPALPVLVITGDLVPEHINRACRPGVAFLAKPFSKEDISRFARSTTDAAEKRLQSALSACARRYRFCAAETEVLSFGLECEEHAEIASRRSCSIHTVQSHVTSMLKKSGARSLHGLVTEVLREAAGLNTGAPPKTSTG